MTNALPILSTSEDSTQAHGDEAGFGALRTERGCLPLIGLDVQAHIDGLLARTDLAQTFVNVHAEHLEATYIFPLPDRAAVTRFRLEVAGRVVEGELKERGQARQEYTEAIEAGHRAAITEEERPGVFTLRVGNLPPGEKAVVRLSLTGPLPYSDGEATFRFPLVVAPRYIPGVPVPGPSVGEGTAADTEAVPDASRITPPVLLPGFPNPVRLSLSVAFGGSELAPEALRSSLHSVLEEHGGDGPVVRLHPGERLDRDFILRYRLATDRVRTALTLQPDAGDGEGTFALTLVPPAGKGAGTPRDLVFVLDRSGSMEGWKMVAARRALARMVDTLTDADRFNVLAFDNTVETPPDLGEGLVSASNRNRFRAVEFLSRIEARGGTEMAQPLERGMDLLGTRPSAGVGQNRADVRRTPDPERILVLVTDGQIGNEDQILRQLAPKAKGVRIFTLGIDQAVNAAFLRRLADLGDGQCELVESEDRLDEVMDNVHRRIGTPVLTRLKLEPAGLAVVAGSVAPARLPDLFAGVPLVLLGRYRGAATGAVALQARDEAGSMWTAEVRADRVPGSAVASVWARARLRDLEDRYLTAGDDRDKLEKEIVATSLRYSVLCRFTAFLAVDRSEVVNPGGKVHGVIQPVELPRGWEGVTLAAAPGYVGHAATRLARSSRSLGAMPAPADINLDSVASCPMPASARRNSGLLKQLLDLFGGKKRKKAIAAVDYAPFVARAKEILEGMRSFPGGDSLSRLNYLAVWIDRLEQLFQDLVTAGDRRAVVERLGEMGLAIRQLLTHASPADALVESAWTDLETALGAFVATVGISRTPTARKDFWK